MSDSSCHRNSILLSCVVSNSFTKQFLLIKKAHVAFIIAKCGSFPFIDIKPFNFHNNLGGRLQTKKQKHRFYNLPRVIWLFDPIETAFSVCSLIPYCLLPTSAVCTVDGSSCMQYSAVCSTLWCFLFFSVFYYFKMVTECDLRNDSITLMATDTKFEDHWLDPLCCEMDTSGYLSLLPETFFPISPCDAMLTQRPSALASPQRCACCERMHWYEDCKYPCRLVSYLSGLGWETGSCESASWEMGPWEIESLDQTSVPARLRAMPWSLIKSSKFHPVTSLQDSLQDVFLRWWFQRWGVTVRAWFKSMAPSII